MNKRTSSALVLGIFGGLAFSAGGFAQYPDYFNDEVSNPVQTIQKRIEVRQMESQKISAGLSAAPNAYILEEAFKIIQEKAVLNQKLDDELRKKLINGAVAGMVRALEDEYSEYVPPMNLEATYDALEGNYEGIGAFIEEKDGKLYVTSPLKGSPAEKAGIKPNDVITKVNGESIFGLTAGEAGQKVRGEAGTFVKLTILRGESEELLELNVKREAIHVPSVTFDWIGSQKTVPMISLHQFDSSTAGTVENLAIMAKKQHDFDTIVLDLRLNPGGYVKSAESIAGLFLKNEQEVFRFAYRDETSVTFAENDGILSDVANIYIMIDGGTASSSEMLIGALKAHKNVTLVGEKTYGKGVIQTFYSLSNGGMIKLTNAKWFTPETPARWVKERPFLPDVEVLEGDTLEKVKELVG